MTLEPCGQPFRAAAAWQRVAASRWAPLLTHLSLAACIAAMFWLLLRAPLWMAIVPCAILEHRIGILIHEYIHGIPFKRRTHNQVVITLCDGLLLCFGLLELFRSSHLAHHRWLNTERDPAWTTALGAATVGRADAARRSSDPGAKPRPWTAALGSLELPQHVAYLWSALVGKRLRVSALRVLLGALMSVGWLVFWIAIGRWWMGLVLLGLVTFTASVPSSLRGAVEHHGRPGDPRFSNEYRSFIPLFNLNRHIHHHIDPRCPWYRLCFITPNPLPAWCFVTHWIDVYVRRRYRMMAPMKSDWRAQLEAGAGLDAVKAIPDHDGEPA
jgi:fatty acid desaturase